MRPAGEASYTQPPEIETMSRSSDCREVLFAYGVAAARVAAPSSRHGQEDSLPERARNREDYKVCRGKGKAGRE